MGWGGYINKSQTCLKLRKPLPNRPITGVGKGNTRPIAIPTFSWVCLLLRVEMTHSWNTVTADKKSHPPASLPIEDWFLSTRGRREYSLLKDDLRTYS